MLPIIEENGLLKSIADSKMSYEQQIIACLALIPNYILEGHKEIIFALFPSIDNQADLAVGLNIFAFFPLLVIFLSSKDGFLRMKESINKTKDYVDLIYMAFTQDFNILSAKRYILDKLLIAFYAGFGITTPSIILPRFSASTQAGMSLNLIAGFTGSGSAHVGACREMMSLLRRLKLTPHSDIEDKIKPFNDEGRKIPGFGHPLFYKDPRNDVLYQLAIQALPSSEYLMMYHLMSQFMQEKYNLSPNIDAIAAAILLAIDVCPELGSVLFLYARIPAMIAHSIEKKSRPAFGFKRSEARERFERFPVDWI